MYAAAYVSASSGARTFLVTSVRSWIEIRRRRRKMMTATEKRGIRCCICGRSYLWSSEFQRAAAPVTRSSKQKRRRRDKATKIAGVCDGQNMNLKLVLYSFTWCNWFRLAEGKKGKNVKIRLLETQSNKMWPSNTQLALSNWTALCCRERIKLEIWRLVMSLTNNTIQGTTSNGVKVITSLRNDVIMDDEEYFEYEETAVKSNRKC